MPDAQADRKVEVYVGGAPVASGNPLPVSNAGGGAAGLTDAELRATPVKVDDDATQALLAGALTTVPRSLVPSANGEIAGSASATQLPNVAGSYFLIRARASNAGTVYLGAANTVTKPDGTADATSGFSLPPGEAIELPLSNLNLLWLISDNVADNLVYMGFTYA